MRAACRGPRSARPARKRSQLGDCHCWACESGVKTDKQINRKESWGGGVKKQDPTCTVNRLSTKAPQLLAGEREVLPTDVPDQVGLSGERMTLALPHTANKNRPRWTTGPNAKAKTTKLPEGNIESLYKFGIGKNFLDRMWKAGTVNKILVIGLQQH